VTLATDVRAAYDAAGDAWAEGPTRLYQELARPLLERAGDVAGRLVLDVGTGSGAVAEVFRAAGARVLAADGSLGMLRPRRLHRPPALVADVQTLPVRGASFDLVTAGFVLNHLADPLPALREGVRALRPGGRLLATTFADEAAVEVKRALQEVAGRHGFVPPRWYAELRHGPLYHPVPARAEALLRQGGLVDVHVIPCEVRVALSTEQLLAWRWGMAQLAPFVARLGPERRTALDADAARAVAGVGELEFRVLVMAGRRPVSEREVGQHLPTG